MLSKLDIAALRACDALCVHLGKEQTIARAIKRADTGRAFARDIEHAIPAAICLESLRGSEELAAGMVTCFAMANLYHSQNHSASLILKTLRAGDEITFSFYPDAHTNGYLAMAGLHGDALYMRVRRDGRQIANWQLVSSICPSNSARMVRGIPNSESYEQDAARARRVA